MSTLLGSSTQFLGQLHPLKVEHGRRRGRYKESEPKRDHGQRCAGLDQVLRTSGEPGAGDRRSTARWDPVVVTRRRRLPSAAPSMRFALLCSSVFAYGFRDSMATESESSFKVLSPRNLPSAGAAGPLNLSITDSFHTFLLSAWKLRGLLYFVFFLATSFSKVYQK